MISITFSDCKGYLHGSTCAQLFQLFYVFVYIEYIVFLFLLQMLDEYFFLFLFLVSGQSVSLSVCLAGCLLAAIVVVAAAGVIIASTETGQHLARPFLGLFICCYF